LKPEKFPPAPEDEEVVSTQKSLLKDSAVLGTLIGVCLFIIIIIVILTLLTKLGYSPGSKLAQSKSVLPCIHLTVISGYMCR
jgi:mannose/fructose/N-acetylgalactosamine-specific phosphotransferase system component IID